MKTKQNTTKKNKKPIFSSKAGNKSNKFMQFALIVVFSFLLGTEQIQIEDTFYLVSLIYILNLIKK